MNLDGQPDRSVGQRSFLDRVALLPGLDLGFLHRVGLEKTVKMFLVTPAAIEVVEMQLTRGRLQTTG